MDAQKIADEMADLGERMDADPNATPEQLDAAKLDSKAENLTISDAVLLLNYLKGMVNIDL